MIGPRILTGQDQQLGVIDVVEGDAGLTDPDGLGQRVAGRLVAHVGAVGQVVGAVRPYEQLVAEGRLVGGTARGVEDRLIRTRQGVELIGDQPKCRIPLDGLVVRRSGLLDHGMGDPALLPEPVLAVPVQVGDAVAGEEFRRRPGLRGFFRNGLGAAFTELSRVPMTRFRIRPGTAHAVETFGLIELEQRTQRTGSSPIFCTDRFNATVTPGIPAACSCGSAIAILASSAS